MFREILYLCALIILIPASDLAAQKVRIKPKDVKKISEVKLEVDGRVFPKAMLYRVNRREMTLVRESSNYVNQETFYIPTEIAIDEFDYITIYNRKRKIWAQIIGGVSLAAVSYVVIDQIYDNKMDNVFLEILNQPPQHRFVEPIVAGIIGAGVGVILGDLLHPVRINVKKDKKLAYEKLKRYSYR